MNKVKLSILAALAVAALLLTACNSAASSASQSASSTPEPASSSEASSVAASSEPEEESAPSSEAEESVPAASTAAESDEDLGAKLTPDDATGITSTPGALVLMSNSSVEDLKAFYEGILKELGAKQITSTQVVGWEYTGTYGDDNKDITIVLLPVDKTTSVTVTY